MKKITLLYICLLSFTIAFGGRKYTLQNSTSDLFASNIWLPLGNPGSGDTLLIPVGKIITLAANGTLPINNMVIHVYGEIAFTAGNATMALNNSSIYVHTGGKITGSKNNQIVSMNGQQIYAGKVNSVSVTINGPMMANASSNGFGAFNDVLPVKFIGFSVAKQTTGILIQWATSEEVNADRYEVERSVDGSNWNTIAHVMAAGNSIAVSNYSYTDKNNTAKTAYYRIKQVDADQRFVYTSVKQIKTEVKGAEVKVAAINNKVVLQFTEQVKNAVEVRLISLNGQVVSKQTFNQPVGQVVFNTNFKGNYIVSVSNAQDIQFAKQVIL